MKVVQKQEYSLNKTVARQFKVKVLVLLWKMLYSITYFDSPIAQLVRAPS